MEVTAVDPLVEELLDRRKDSLGGDLPGYRNHVVRVLHFYRAFRGTDGEFGDKAVLAACFHDMGIWTDRTYDYLGPSVRRAVEYLSATGRGDWAGEIGLMISEHHKITPYRGPWEETVEAFRRADWTDISLGAVRFGLPRDFVRRVRSDFPNQGFHRRLLVLTLRRMLAKPWSPLPMFKW